MVDLPDSNTYDVIVNLAGARVLGWRWTAKRKRVLRSSRVELTRGIVAWIAKAEIKPRLLLSASAIGYYGIQKHGDDTVLTEKSEYQSVFMSELCQDWEKEAQVAVDYGVNVICMRFGLVLGRQGVLPMMIMPNQLGLGGPLGGGQQWISWIHIHDLLRAMAYLWSASLNTENQGGQFAVYNFTAPEAVKQIDFSKITGRVIHRPSSIPTPGFVMRLPLGEQSDLLLEGQRVAPTRLSQEGFKFTYPQLYDALHNLC